MGESGREPYGSPFPLVRHVNLLDSPIFRLTSGMGEITIISTNGGHMPNNTSNQPYVVQTKKSNQGYEYFEFCYGPHNSKKLVVWVSRGIAQNGTLKFPITGAHIQITKKKNFVIRPADGTVFVFENVSGYRGTASIKVVSGTEVAQLEILHSPRGKFGKTVIALINGPGHASVDVKWHRTNRHGEESVGFSRLIPDGHIEDLIDDPDVLNFLDE